MRSRGARWLRSLLHFSFFYIKNLTEINTLLQTSFIRFLSLKTYFNRIKAPETAERQFQRIWRVSLERNRWPINVDSTLHCHINYNNYECSPLNGATGTLFREHASFLTLLRRLIGYDKSFFFITFKYNYCLTDYTWFCYILLQFTQHRFLS